MVKLVRCLGELMSGNLEVEFVSDSLDELFLSMNFPLIFIGFIWLLL